MRHIHLRKTLLYVLYLLGSLSISSYAYPQRTPLFSFAPITPTTIKVPKNQTAIIQYTLTNKSYKTHTLQMIPIEGITQITSTGNCTNPLTLNTQQSCVLTLEVNGAQIPTQITGGPQICQQGPDGTPNPLQCYQPHHLDSLHIKATSASSPTLYTGTANGLVYSSTDNGSTWTASTSPTTGGALNSVVATTTILYAGAANGSVYSSSDNGSTWSLIVTPAPGFSVNGLYVSDTNRLYIASGNGTIFICALNGAHCFATNAPHSGFAVNGVAAASSNTLYATNADGNIYYSTDAGISWTTINGQPDGSATLSIYVAANTLYVNTVNEFVYTSTAVTGGGTWTPYAQTIYSFYVNTDASQIFAGNQTGFVFSLATGTQLGFVANTVLNSIFWL